MKRSKPFAAVSMLFAFVISAAAAYTEAADSRNCL